MAYNDQTIILLYGIDHSMRNMLLLAKVLKRQGDTTCNITYPSLRHDIKTLLKWLHDKLEKKQSWQSTDKAYFVTHSNSSIIDPPAEDLCDAVGIVDIDAQISWISEFHKIPVNQKKLTYSNYFKQG